ncbi:MAG TPA: S8 family serine peptidase [Pyrinomonadaceae bacterium]|nr:S8 family serine peptidase [Pyrinomonadaceae bacterium]
MADEKDTAGDAAQARHEREECPAGAGGAGEAPPEESGGSLWVPNVIELQLKRGMRSQVSAAPNGAMCEFKSLSNASGLDEVNKILLENNCVDAARVFDLPEDAINSLQERASKQEVDLPDMSGFYILRFAGDADMREVAEKLKRAAGVEHAAPIPRTKPASAASTGLPEDELLFPSGVRERRHQWYIFDRSVDDAWRRQFTGRGVVIADIDFGFFVDHPDLQGRLNLDRAFNSADPACDPDVGRCNVSQGGQLRHGTAVLGQAGAGANGRGIVGIAHNAELWPVQVNVTRPSSFLDTCSWVRAIMWVADASSGNMRKVILLEGQTEDNGNITQIAVIRAAVQYAIVQNAVVCVPAGNGNKPVNQVDGRGGATFQPVGIIVGATTRDGQPWEGPLLGTNFGDDVTVAAPGDPDDDLTCATVFNPVYNDFYRHNFGATSGAAAKVAGVVALMLEANKGLRHVDVIKIFSTTGTPVASGPKKLGRLLNCDEAVRAAENFVVQ